MTAGFHRESAKIYQFPVKAIRQPNRFEKMRMLEREAEAYSDAVMDDCWYHQEAVSDTKPVVKS